MRMGMKLSLRTDEMVVWDDFFRGERPPKKNIERFVTVRRARIDRARESRPTIEETSR